MIRTFRDNILPHLVRAEIHRNFELFRRGNVLNLYFHGVEDDGKKINMPYWMFIKIMSYLYDNYKIIPLNECLNQQREQCITISFDDGLGNLIYNAAPFLMGHSIPATFFVCPGLLGKEGYMTEDEVKLLSEHFDIGSHSMYHRNFRESVGGLTAHLDLRKSRVRIERIIEKPCTMFCFPWCVYSQEAIEMALKEYDMIFGEKPVDKKVIPRYCISNTTTIPVLKSLISKAFITHGIKVEIFY